MITNFIIESPEFLSVKGILFVNNQPRQFYNLLVPVIHRITGYLVEETRVLKQSTRSIRRQRWKSTRNRLKSNSSSCPRKKEEGGWEGAWGAEVLTHQEGAGPASLRMRDGTQCLSPRIDPSTPHALARSQRSGFGCREKSASLIKTIFNL